MSWEAVQGAPKECQVAEATRVPDCRHSSEVQLIVLGRQSTRLAIYMISPRIAE